MSKRNLILTLVLFLFVLVQSSLAQRMSPEQIKADYLFSYPKYLQWPNDEELDVITIGLLTDHTKLVTELKEISKKGYNNGVKVKVIRFAKIEDIVYTNELYVDSSYNYWMLQVIKKIEGNATALVTENYHDKKYIQLNFLENKNGISFQVNFENLAATKIIKYPQFSQLGGVEITTKTLFEESEKNLESEKKTVKSQKEELKRQQKEIETQNDKIKTQIEAIQKQQAKIDGQKVELASIMSRTQKLSQELQIKSEILDKQGEEIKTQTAKITEQQAAVKHQSEILTKQSSEIESGQKRIEDQRKDITSLNLTIAIQKNLILIFTIFTIIILVMSFFLFKAYRKIRADNVKLAEQKQEIEQKTDELEIINRELEKLSIVASETSSAVVIMDNKGNFEWINAGFTRLYGYTFQLLKHELDENIIKASNHPDIANIIEKCLNEKHPIIYETFVTSRSGQKKWAQTTLSPILDNNNEVKKLVLIDSDITKIKEVEAEIIKRNEMITAQARQLELTNKELEKLSLVASKTDNSVIIAKPDGELEWVNDGFTRLLGLDFADFKQTYGSNLFTASLNPNLREMVEAGMAERSSIVYSAKTTTRKGRLIWIQTTLTPIFDANDQLTKFIAIDADVTKIKQAEEEIAKQKEKIIESIQYASRIQTAVLPPTELLDKILPQYFVFFHPKDIVSGDFYWAMQIGNKSVIVAADCTGHGVPGAFITLIACFGLKKILWDEGIRDPALILKRLNFIVKTTLRQDTDYAFSDDGLDAAICFIRPGAGTLTFAGAKLSLFYVYENELTVIKGDRKSLGYKKSDLAFNFNNYKLSLKEGMSFYLTTDGFADQLGGTHRRRFGIRSFQELLTEHSSLPLEKQRGTLLEAFYGHKGENDRQDDVTVVGFRL